MDDFIREHRLDDVRELALQAQRYPNVDMKGALQQIDGWQRARKKLPMWAETDGIVYPAHLSMEQCSSELTARYKAGIVEGDERMTDLTAGVGVDGTMMAQKYGQAMLVEQNEELCAIVRHNLPLLGVKNAEVVCAKAEEALHEMARQDLIFLDPARRDVHGGKVVSIADCTPDVSVLQEELMRKAETVMIKLSPMLDIKSVVRDLKGVSEVHVVSVENECKELLVKLCHSAEKVRTFCVNIDADGKAEMFDFDDEMEVNATCRYVSEVGRFVYEPNASIMKAGGFKVLAERYGIGKFHPNSHLYTTDDEIADFPGRRFRVVKVSGLGKTETRGLLDGLTQANLSVRNFPMSVAELRKRLKIREGGDKYLYATTLNDNRKVLLLLDRIK